MIPVRRLNHAVLYVSDLKASLRFYQEVFGMELIAQEGPMGFLRARGSANHHDLGLLALGPGTPHAPEGTTGLYHLAWELGSIEELAAARDVLMKAKALRGASDHGATKSLYGADPDGNEFEIMVLMPREAWGEYEHRAPVLPLNWEKELSRSKAPKKAR